MLPAAGSDGFASPARTSMRGGAAWLVPLVRSVRWVPLLAASGALVLGVVVDAAADGPVLAPPVVSLALALVAAAVITGLDDPAAEVLAAVPSSRVGRLAARLVALSTVGAVATAAVLHLGARVGVIEPAWHRSAEAFVVLVCAALLVHVGLERRRPDLAAVAAAVVPIAWVLAGSIVEDGRPGASLAHAWSDPGWPIAVVAVAATAALSIRR